MFDLSKFLCKAGGRIGAVLTQKNTELLVGLGIGGFTASIVTAIRATKRAQIKIESAREERVTNHFNEETGHWETSVVNDLTKLEEFKIAAPCYIPTTILAAASATVIVVGTRNALAGKAAIATAFSALSEEYRDYRRSVEETVTAEKKKQIDDKVNKKIIERAESVGAIDSVITTPGDVVVYERLTGRTFSSNQDKLIKITNELNRRMRTENYISLNDFYDEVGLSQTAIGYEMGWNIDRGYIDPRFGATLDSKGRPCMTLDFDIPPQADYQNW